MDVRDVYANKLSLLHRTEGVLRCVFEESPKISLFSSPWSYHLLSHVTHINTFKLEWRFEKMRWMAFVSEEATFNPLKSI